MIPVVILWAGIIMTNTASDGASQMVTNFGQNIVRRTGRGLRRGGRYMAVGTGRFAAREAGRGLDAVTGRVFTGAYRNLRSRYTGAAERRTRRREEARDTRAASMYLNEERRAAEQLRVFNRAVAAAAKELKDSGADQSPEALRRQMTDVNATAAQRVAAARIYTSGGHVQNVGEYQQARETVQNAPIAQVSQQAIQGEFERNLQRNNQRIFLAQHDQLPADQGGAALGARQAFHNRLGGLSARDLASQQNIDNIAGDRGFNAYVRGEIATDPARHQRVFNELSTNAQRQWAAHGLHPQGGNGPHP